MAGWLVVLVAAAVVAALIALAVFMWTHRAGRLARGIGAAADQYNRFVGMGEASRASPPTTDDRRPEE